MNEILYNNLSWDEYLLGDKLGLRYTDEISSLEKRCNMEMNKREQPKIYEERKPIRECFVSKPNRCTCGADSENNTFRSDVVQHSPNCNLRKSLHRQIRMLETQEEPEYDERDEPDVFSKKHNSSMVESLMSIFDNNRILTLLVFFLSVICLFQYLNHQEAMEEMNKLLTQIQLLHSRHPMMNIQAPMAMMV